MSKFKREMNKFGTVEFNGKKLELTQDAYIAQDIATQQNYYEALAKDEQENEYQVTWEITHEDPENCDDESNMCDWDKYTVTQL